MKKGKALNEAENAAKNESNKGDIKGPTERIQIRLAKGVKIREPFDQVFPRQIRQKIKFNKALIFLADPNNLKEESENQLKKHILRLNKSFPELAGKDIEKDAMRINAVVTLFFFAFDGNADKQRLAFFNLWLKIHQAIELNFKLESITLHYRKGKKVEKFNLKDDKGEHTARFLNYKDIDGKQGKYKHVNHHRKIFKAVEKAYQQIIKIQVIEDRINKGLAGPMTKAPALRVTLLNAFIDEMGRFELLEKVMALGTKERLLQYFEELIKTIAPQLPIDYQYLNKFFKNHFQDVLSKVLMIEKAVRLGKAKVQYDSSGKINRIEIFNDEGRLIKVMGRTTVTISGKTPKN